MIERIKQIISHFGINQKQLSDKIEVSGGNITEWLKGRSLPKAEAIIRICEVFNINANWLLTGSGSMLLTDQPKPELPEEDAELLSDAKDLVKKHSNFIHNGKYVLNVTRSNYEGRNDKSHLKDKEDPAVGNVGRPQKISDQQTKIIPLYGSKICAGNGTFAYDDIEDMIDVQHEATKNADFVLTVTGDSMDYAGIYSGDKVLVKTGQDAYINDIVVAELPSKEFTLKRLEQQGNELFLVPANKHYYSILVTEDIKIVGVVTGVFRKF